MGITDKFAHLQAPKQLKDMEIAVFWGRGRGRGRGEEIFSTSKVITTQTRRILLLGSVKSALLKYDYSQQIPVLGKQRPRQSFSLEVLTTNPFSTIQISRVLLVLGEIWDQAAECTWYPWSCILPVTLGQTLSAI